MKPEKNSQKLLTITWSKAKMYEYGLPEESHIAIPGEPAQLFPLSIGMLGDLAAEINKVERNQSTIREMTQTLSFSAQFFYAYLRAQFHDDLQPILSLLDSAAFYLCDLPGSSKLLAEEVRKTSLDLDGLGLERLLHWVLQGNLTDEIEIPEGLYQESIREIVRTLRQFNKTGEGTEALFAQTAQILRAAYKDGTAKQLLFADVVSAVIRKRYENSTWKSIPAYSEIPLERWRRTFQKENFIKELWPAQHLIGEHGVYKGKSAIIQMPTSAGKTKAIEIIIRSAFLSNRTTLVVIVAPFRTLCHEIRENLKAAFRDDDVTINELSDVNRIDFTIGEVPEDQQILVVTPEKLNYVLHHKPELGGRIGLLLLDEGHQFDSGIRGITYELLITLLKEKIDRNAQIVLLSAVINNAEQIGQWLGGDGTQIVAGGQLTPPIRSLGFSRWQQDEEGIIWFVNPKNPDEEEYYVPQIIQQYEYTPQKNRGKKGFFPKRPDQQGNGNDIALYLGLKLVNNGSVVIFCGRKDSVRAICDRANEIFDGGIELPKPLTSSNGVEVNKIHSQIVQNLGRDASAAKSAEKGIFGHHHHIPQGIRLAVEHAFKEGMIKYVVCTSTLAQGVNLPIRYLIVTGTRQGRANIKVRDFQNLIGRTGRAGMQVEGTILFSDPKVYQSKSEPDEQNIWNQTKEMLSPDRSEPCGSTLFTLFDKLQNEKKTRYIEAKPLELVRRYISGYEEIERYIQHLTDRETRNGFTKEGLTEQVTYRMKIIFAIENFILAHIDEENPGLETTFVRELARGTLAYHIGDENQKGQIEELFTLLAENIERLVPEPARRIAFGKTLFGIYDNMRISAWLDDNTSALIGCEDGHKLLDCIWPIMTEMIENRPFVKCSKPEIRLQITHEWMDGKTYEQLFGTLSASGAVIRNPRQERKYILEDLIDMCEEAIAYEGTLILGAIIDLLEMRTIENGNEKDRVMTGLQALLKRLKYGLTNANAIMLFECGFCDRVIATELAAIFDGIELTKENIGDELRFREDQVLKVLNRNPSYFSEVYSHLI